MKYIKILLLSLLLVNGCDKKIEVNSTDNKKIEEEKTSSEFIDATFVEEYESSEYATTITFYSDGTFSSYLNVCKAMIDVKGEYTITDGKVYLYFKEGTGFDFIDKNQPYIFKYENDRLIIDSESVSYSCAYVDKYSIR